MGKERIKLEGNQINNWFIEEYVGELKYRCRCTCGNIEIVSGKNIRNGISTRCKKCYEKERKNKHVGKIFGNWKVLEYAGDKKQICQCLKCNNIVEVFTESLVSGKSTQCRKCASSYRKEENKLEGKSFGSWYVDEYLGLNKYKCICKCGHTEVIVGNNLIVGHTTQCKKCSGQEFKDIEGQVFGELKAIEYVGNGKWKCVCSCERTEVIHGYFLRTGDRTRCKYCSDMGQASDAEKYILNIFDKAEARNRSVLENSEIDIFLPDKNIGIEFNGDYWHSSLFKDKYYHYNKSIKAAKNGVHLIHIFEYEWNDKRTRNILEQMLMNINSDKRIKLYARNLNIKIVGTEERARFLENNHIQGDTNSSINIALVDDNGNIVALMTFGKPRFDNRDDVIELIRYCTKTDVIIIGGAEKIFKYFLNNYNAYEVISYCDISKFTGAVYNKLGFNLLAISEPNYVWIKGNKVLKRYQTQKHKLIEAGLGTEEQTENEIMESLGYIKVYDCGNYKFIFKK